MCRCNQPYVNQVCPRLAGCGNQTSNLAFSSSILDGGTEDKMASKSSEYIGMGKRQAQNRAELDNFIFRLIRVDGESFLPYPDDTRNDRLCVEIDGGKVTKAVIR